MKVEIYSDVACPWCYVGKVRFERALTAFPGADDVEVSYRPFQLNPKTPEQPQPLYDYYDKLFGPGFRTKHSQVSDIARQEGLDFRMDRALAVNTFTAHRLLWLAERHHGAQTQQRLKDALLRTYFTDGGNIADIDTLVGLAAEVGMDGEQVREWLTSDAGTAEVRDEIAHAGQLGINSVPTFVFQGKWAVQGAQPTSTFLQVLEQVQAETHATAGGSDGAVSDGEGTACTDESRAI